MSESPQEIAAAIRREIVALTDTRVPPYQLPADSIIEQAILRALDPKETT